MVVRGGGDGDRGIVRMHERETGARQTHCDLTFGDEGLDAGIVDHEVETIVGVGGVER